MNTEEFNNKINLHKFSILQPLFRNLVLMGNRIQALIIANKELSNMVGHELRTPISRFVQLNNQMAGKVQGYGLGLAITKKMIEQHQWLIHVEKSNLGGAKFIITIPKNIIQIKSKV